MLIGFSGSCNSGKTTLARLLAEELRSRGFRVELIEEVVREVFEEWGSSSLEELRRGEHDRFQLEVLKRQLERENVAMKRAEVVIVDRTIYDNLFYTILWNSKNWRVLNEYARMIGRIGRRYDIVFHCRPLNGVCRDGFRDPDLRYVDLQDVVIELLADRENLVIVEEGSVKERLDFILKKLSLHLSYPVSDVNDLVGF